MRAALVTILLLTLPLAIAPVASAACRIGSDIIGDAVDCVFTTAEAPLNTALNTCAIVQDLTVTPAVTTTTGSFVPSASFLAIGANCFARHAQSCTIAVSQLPDTNAVGLPASCTFPGPCDLATTVCHAEVRAGATVTIADHGALLVTASLTPTSVTGGPAPSVGSSQVVVRAG